MYRFISRTIEEAIENERRFSRVCAILGNRERARVLDRQFRQRAWQASLTSAHSFETCYRHEYETWLKDYMESA